MKLKELIRQKVFKPYSLKFENHRNEVIKENIDLNTCERILDLGGGTGTRMKSLFPNKTNGIYIADISEQALDVAKNKHGFETILLDESGKIPFEDAYFDFIFCNSVIEHVTVDKSELYNITSNKIFKEKSLFRQKTFADEIKRVSKNYYVQTPNKHFIIESHLWFPSLYLYLPRKMKIKLMLFLNKFWIKSSSPDFSLLDFNEFKNLFSEAKIIREKSMGLTKSLIAIKDKPNN